MVFRKRNPAGTSKGGQFAPDARGKTPPLSKTPDEIASDFIDGVSGTEVYQRQREFIQTIHAARQGTDEEYAGMNAYERQLHALQKLGVSPERAHQTLESSARRYPTSDFTIQDVPPPHRPRPSISTRALSRSLNRLGYTRNRTGETMPNKAGYTITPGLEGRIDNQPYAIIRFQARTIDEIHYSLSCIKELLTDKGLIAEWGSLQARESYIIVR